MQQSSQSLRVDLRRRGATGWYRCRMHVQVDYQPDFRQDIAASWPQSIDDSRAREDWGWRPRFDISAMTDDMLAALLRKYDVRGGCVVGPPQDPDSAKAAIAG